MGKAVKQVMEVLKANGYPVHITRSARKFRKREQEEEESKYRICLPCVSGLNEDLRRILRRFDIRTMFTTTSTLRQPLTRVIVFTSIFCIELSELLPHDVMTMLRPSRK